PRPTAASSCSAIRACSARATAGVSSTRCRRCRAPARWPTRWRSLRRSKRGAGAHRGRPAGVTRAGGGVRRGTLSPPCPPVSRMRLLAIETSTEACSVAVLAGGEVRERFELAPRRHAELVLPWAEALLAEA